jgi:TolB protein
VTGGVVVRDGDVEFELRLFDTVKEKMLVGKRYRGSAEDHRQVARRFGSEVVFAITGSRGFFDSKIAFVPTAPAIRRFTSANLTAATSVDLPTTTVFRFFPTGHRTAAGLPIPPMRTRAADSNSACEGKPERKINKPGLQAAPAWVPGKFELAASLSFSGDQEIYLLTGNGKVIKRLTSSVGIDVEPTWSPDGKRMAFVSKRSGNPQIYIYDTVSGRVQRLTFEGRYNTQPSWSPKGDRIAYSAMHNGVIDIFTINPEGGEPTQLTENQGNNEAPSWSPDGSLIAFSSTREGKSRIYVMTAYGTDQRRLLTLPGEQTNPKWSPNIINP